MAKTIVPNGAFEEMKRAMRDGCIDALEELVIRHPGLINYKPHKHFSWLQTACHFEQPKVAEWLVNKGVPVNRVDGLGRSPAWVALHDYASTEILRVLLSRGANPDFSLNQQSLLHAAVGKPLDMALLMVEALLKHGANPNVMDEHGQTPLHAAAIYNNPQLAMRLLASGADPDLRGPGQPTVLDLAQQWGRHQFISEVSTWIDAARAHQAVLSASNTASPRPL